MRHLLKTTRLVVSVVTTAAALALSTLVFAAPVELIGVGTTPGTASDGLSLIPIVLEDGTPHDRAGGFGSALAYTGVGSRYIAVPDRGPRRRHHQLSRSLLRPRRHGEPRRGDAGERLHRGSDPADQRAR